ncbi:hypothetical protein EG832_17120, partial [bacterium]|nr:hypothetical protein [bacterium]
MNVEPGDQTFSYDLDYTIPADADDIEYTVNVTFQNMTKNTTVFLNNQKAFFVRTPMIIVHGIMGSTLERSDLPYPSNKLWDLGILSDFAFNSQLQCDSNGQSVNPILANRVIKTGIKSKVLDTVFYLDVYDGLEKYLKELDY